MITFLLWVLGIIVYLPFCAFAMICQVPYSKPGMKAPWHITALLIPALPIVGILFLLMWIAEGPSDV